MVVVAVAVAAVAVVLAMFARMVVGPTASSGAKQGNPTLILHIEKLTSILAVVAHHTPEQPPSPADDERL